VETKNKVILATFDPTKINWKFSVKQSNRRMKLYIKMNKAETSQWEELRKAAKPPEMSDDEFAKILFYRGIDAFMSQMTDMINNMSDEEKAKAFEEEGAEVPEELKEPTREELAALGKIDSETSKEENA
jgi:preprotein translocase subunit Sss1